jgi:phosphoribosyl 1,2-cyclic phosphodiesterase
LRFASLGSGSEGNGLLVQSSDGTRVSQLLIDCGFSLSEAERRLRAADAAPERLDGIVVTHEHGDHLGGVYKLALAHGIPVYLTHGTQTAGPRVPAGVSIREIQPDRAFELAGFSIMPVSVPHDAREPVQFVVDDGRVRLGVLTDIGHGTPHVQRAYSGLDALVLECNHDAKMLATNPTYPEALKRRIGGPYGHLANAAAAAILAGLERSRLRSVVAAHLSQRNNTTDLARQALCEVLECESEGVTVAGQEQGFAWISV